MPSWPIVLAAAAVAFAPGCASAPTPMTAPPSGTCPPISDPNQAQDTTRVSNAYWMWQTTRAARMTSHHPLRYPGRDGAIMAWVVIDTAGRAELATLGFEDRPDQAFKDEVRSFLAAAEFEPAELGPGCRVRMWARMPFVFNR